MNFMELYYILKHIKFTVKFCNTNLEGVFNSDILYTLIFTYYILCKTQRLFEFLFLTFSNTCLFLTQDIRLKFWYFFFLQGHIAFYWFTSIGPRIGSYKNSTTITIDLKLKTNTVFLKRFFKIQLSCVVCYKE